MRRLQSVSLAAAMAMIAAIGFSLILAYASIGLVQDMHQQRATNIDEELTLLAQSVGGLTHELQKERGASAGFLASDGANFSDELPRQRDLSDARIAAFLTTSETVSRMAEGTPLEKRLAAVESQIAALPELRALVDRQEVSIGVAVEEITRLNRNAIALLPELGRSIAEPDAARAVQRHAILMTAKDIIGLERATGATGFARAASGSGTFPPAIRARFARLIQDEALLLSIYRNIASRHMVRKFEVFEASDALATVQEMRSFVLSDDADRITATAPEAWFSAITELIDQFKTLEDAGGAEIERMMAAASAQAERGLTKSVMQLMGTLLVFAVLTGYLMRAATGTIRKTTQQVSALVKGDFDTPIAQAPQRDLAKITNALETFRLAELERKNQAEEQERVQTTAAEGIQRICDFVAEGDFSRKLRLRDLSGSNLVLGNGINRILDVARETVDAQRARDAEELARRQREAETQETMLEELNCVVQACAEGDFSHRMNTDGLDGVWIDVATGINDIAATTDSALDDIRAIMHALAEGDLTVKMRGDFRGTFAEIGSASNQSLENLTQAFHRIEGAVGSIHDAADQLRAGTAELTERSVEQSNSSGASRKATAKLAEVITDNKGHLQTCHSEMATLEQQAENSRVIALDAISSMQMIENASSEMSEIVSTIEDIAFQTNLLALNASVEAARAGEAGKGFSVVASEVRSLANRCSTASSQISELIAESVKEVTQGAANVQQTGRAIEGIQDALQTVSRRIGEVAETGLRQMKDVNSLNLSIEQMASTATSNAALAQQNSSLMDQFLLLEDQLLDTLGSFKTSGEKRDEITAA